MIGNSTETSPDDRESGLIWEIPAKIAGEAMVMGPVISAKARQFILEMIDKGYQEGAKLVMDGRNVKVQK